MRTDADPSYSPPLPQPHRTLPSPAEPVDLEDPTAVRRAITLHRAGKAVFVIPFNSQGQGTLTWLDTREHEAAADPAHRAA